MISQKVEFQYIPSFRRKPESIDFREFWTPAFAGVTLLGAFYEIINLCRGQKLPFSKS